MTRPRMLNVMTIALCTLFAAASPRGDDDIDTLLDLVKGSTTEADATEAVHSCVMKHMAGAQAPSGTEMGIKHALLAACVRQSPGQQETDASSLLESRFWCDSICQWTKKVTECLYDGEEEMQQLLQDVHRWSLVTAVADGFEALVNSILGELAKSAPTVLYEKAQCILWTRAPAPDTEDATSAYSSWAEVQEATRFALLAYHQKESVNYLFTGCKSGQPFHPLATKEISTCAPSVESLDALRYENFYTQAKQVDSCENWWSKYTLVRYFDENDKTGFVHKGTEALIAKDDATTVWVAFRGSESPMSFDPSHVNDWIKDLTFNVVPWKYTPAGDAKIHSGFLAQYDQVRSAGIIDELTKLHDDGYRHFYFTGHSLGGALAQVGSLDFAQVSKSWQDTKTHMITLAAPEPFDTSLAAVHRELIPSATRIVYNTDVVTCAFGQLSPSLTTLVKVANLGKQPFVDNTAGKLLYWSHKEQKWRGTRDYKCFDPDISFGSDLIPLAGAIDHLCRGYLEKSSDNYEPARQ